MESQFLIWKCTRRVKPLLEVRDSILDTIEHLEDGEFNNARMELEDAKALVDVAHARLIVTSEQRDQWISRLDEISQLIPNPESYKKAKAAKEAALRLIFEKFQECMAKKGEWKPE